VLSALRTSWFASIVAASRNDNELKDPEARSLGIKMVQLKGTKEEDAAAVELCKPGAGGKAIVLEPSRTSK
jgi:hypothetical protein